jgi:hypothetical protein
MWLVADNPLLGSPFPDAMHASFSKGESYTVRPKTCAFKSQETSSRQCFNIFNSFVNTDTGTVVARLHVCILTFARYFITNLRFVELRHSSSPLLGLCYIELSVNYSYQTIVFTGLETSAR